MRKPPFTLLILFCLYVTVHALDTLTDNAAFDQSVFDTAFAEGAKTDIKNRLEYLPGLFFISETNGYHAMTAGGYGSDTKFYGKGFLKASKADVGSLFIGCNFNYFLYTAANTERLRNFYQVQTPDPKKIAASLSEIHLSFDIQKRVFIRLGKQLISWGSGYFWSPEDFINLQKSQPSIFSVVDVRTGKPGLRLHIPLHTANLFLFTDFSSRAPGTISGAFSETIAQAWRLEGTLAGVNIGTVGYLSKGNPAKIGFDATGNAFATDIYGELALSFLSNRNTPATAFSVGASRLFGQEKNWTCRGEFYYNDTGYSDVRISELPPGSFTPFYSGKYYAYAELSGANLFSSLFNCSIYGFINLADRSYSTTLQGTFTLPRLVPITVFARYFGGNSDREFTSSFGGKAWAGGLRIMVDF
jgi:hypothetical protein